MEQKKRKEKKGIEKVWNKEKMEQAMEKKVLEKEMSEIEEEEKKKKRNDRY